MSDLSESDVFKNKLSFKKEKRILEIFEKAGIDIGKDDDFSVKGQISSLLKGSESLINECAKIAETQEKKAHYQWMKGSFFDDMTRKIARQIRSLY